MAVCGQLYGNISWRFLLNVAQINNCTCYRISWGCDSHCCGGGVAVYGGGGGLLLVFFVIVRLLDDNVDLRTAWYGRVRMGDTDRQRCLASRLS